MYKFEKYFFSLILFAIVTIILSHTYLKSIQVKHSKQLRRNEEKLLFRKIVRKKYELKCGLIWSGDQNEIEKGKQIYLKLRSKSESQLIPVLQDSGYIFNETL